MQGTPSRTAFGVAGRRAAHQLLDRPLIFEDPLPVRIVGGNPDLSETPMARALRAFMAVRSRYAEDQLAAAVAGGIRQYVVLGAGLDTFGCRNPSGIRVFEVDHPATQARKRELLDRAGIEPPASLRFVPVDFEREDMESGLRGAGFDAGAPVFFSWLGVAPYLTREAFDRTLTFFSSTAPASAVVFDWCVLPSLMNAPERMAFEALAARVASAGEPFQLFFDPSELECALESAGFTDRETLGRDEINLRYFAGRRDGLCVPGAAARLTRATRVSGSSNT